MRLELVRLAQERLQEGVVGHDRARAFERRAGERENGAAVVDAGRDGVPTEEG